MRTARACGSLIVSGLLLVIAPGCESEPLTHDTEGEGALLSYTKSGGEIACGQERCVVGEEACCWPGSGLNDGFCIAIADVESGAAVVEGCQAIDISVSRALTCQGMGDCVDGATCCNEQDHTSRCLPAAAGENPCALYESCRTGESCLVAGTLCFDYFDEQLCLTSSQSVSCGDRVCEGATQACCYSPEADPIYACRGLNACNPVDGGTRYTCTAPDDCAPGYDCCAVEGAGTLCLGECDLKVCSSDDDCPAEAPSCTEDERFMPGLMVCN